MRRPRERRLRGVRAARVRPREAGMHVLDGPVRRLTALPLSTGKSLQPSLNLLELK